MDKDRVGTVVGFTLGGALLFTGVILIAVGVNAEDDEETVSFHPAPGGLAVTF